MAQDGGQSESGRERSGGNAAAPVWQEGEPPFSPRFGDHYFSRHDGRSECRHVFIAGNALPERWQGRSRFVIGELGFGTGLNILETWRLWTHARQTGQTLSVVSFEKYPMSRADISRALSAWPDLDDLTRRLTAAWPEQAGDGETIGIALDDATSLAVVIGDAGERLAAMEIRADAWYLDGFSPARNPQMWSQDLMGAIYRATAPGGTFATYTAAGWVRRNLANAGFIVERTPGHAGKRDMTRGHREPQDQAAR